MMDGQRLPCAQRVYAETKEQILSGALDGGSLLSEVEFASKLQVSRTPVREAFVRLADEGLLSLLPRRGAVVVPVSPTEAVDILDVRAALEVSAVQRLALRPDRIDLLEYARAELARQIEHAATTDIEAFAASDQRFHRAIVDAADNALASRFYATLGDRQRRMTTRAVTCDLAPLGRLVKEHRSLLGHVDAGDVAGFAATLRAHFVDTHRILLGT
jgi:DNA-binding GntR family transcriptional regulator